MTAGPIVVDAAPVAGGSPIRRLLRLARPVSGRLLLACVLGAMAIGSSVGVVMTGVQLGNDEKD